MQELIERNGESHIVYNIQDIVSEWIPTQIALLFK